jgi:predicted AlkP superfamily pyrophosphatase or phosphodiesterase
LSTVFSNKKKTVLLLFKRISLDGFRADKLEEFLLNNPNSNFQTMMLNKGVKAEYMMPSFPSLTFPNHFTLVTGLFMENHGIVGNDLYDPNYNEYVNLIRDGKGKDIRFWNATEPIWESARKQGLKTASSFWAGSEVWLKNPDIFLPYNDEFLFESRCDEVINWFTKFELDFATLYWNGLKFLNFFCERNIKYINRIFIKEPDKTGHKYGPDSPQYMDKIAEVDKSIGYLFTKLNESNLIEKLNVIITSDHGMASMNGSMLVKDFIDLSLIDSKKSIFGIVSNIWPSSDALVIF